MTAIPYTVERRPDTGVNNVQLGMWLFIASEVMLFGGLFSAYFMLRAGAPAPWLPLRDHLVGALQGTVMILAAGGALLFARRLAAASSAHVWAALAAAAGFAMAFGFFKFADYAALIDHHLGPASSTQMATYFLLTGVHLLHVVGGLIAIAWAAVRTGAAPDPLPAANRLRALALYWMFVDVMWVIIFVLLYVA
jgi:heme/copper-type cytochrome/quinol oxidase subunit 3